MPPRLSRRPLAAAALLALAALLAGAGPAAAHATVSPTSTDPGAEITLTIQSIVEREALINTEIRTVVPRQWVAVGCAGPAVRWSCTIDRKAVAPHALVVFRPTVQPLPSDVDFSITVRAPRNAPGVYLFRTLQTHADGWVEPWVYDKEPYPAPRVQVGSATRLVNGQASRERPTCFGPDRQPKDYASHDGSGTDGRCAKAKQAQATALSSGEMAGPFLLTDQPGGGPRDAGMQVAAALSAVLLPALGGGRLAAKA